MDRTTAVQSAPVKLNSDAGIGTLHFMPGLRNVDVQGNLNLVRSAAKSPLSVYRRVRRAWRVSENK
jgi:hypothetical protein